MEDRELVECITEQGHSGLYSEVLKRYSGMVYSKALGIVRREELAAEVTQETFVKAYERLRVWRGQQLGPWLMTIAMHTALHILEKEQRRRGPSAESVSEQVADFFDEEHEEMILRMEQAINSLPQEDQELIRLHYYEHRKTADIAHLTGLSQQNVLVRLHRIREKLKEKLRVKN